MSEAPPPLSKSTPARFSLVRGLLPLLVGLPLIYSALRFVFWVIGSLLFGGPGEALSWILFPVFLIFCVRCGAKHAALRLKEGIGEGVWPRYQAVLVAYLFTVILAVVAIRLPLPDEGPIFGTFAMIFGLPHFASAVLPAMTSSFNGAPWTYLIVPFGIYSAYWLGMLWGYRRVPFSLSAAVTSVGIAALALGGSVDVILRGEETNARRVSQWPDGEVPNEQTLAASFPILQHEELPILSTRPTLSEEPLRLAARASAAPLLQALEHLASVEGELLASQEEALKRLQAGEITAWLTTEPKLSNSLVAIPIARQALGILVSKENCTDQISQEQLRRIYQRQIKNWQALGQKDLGILAFQRPAGSESQRAFERLAMRGERSTPPLLLERINGRHPVERRIAAYQVRTESIGYSFWNFRLPMELAQQTRWLAIDGVMPTPETIRSGAYPFTLELYLVTTAHQLAQAQPLVDWLRSPDGKALLEATGYTAALPAP